MVSNNNCELPQGRDGTPGAFSRFLRLLAGFLMRFREMGMNRSCISMISAAFVSIASSLAAPINVLNVPAESSGPPWYADFAADFVPSNGTDAAIVFWRNPDGVPDDFNLLDLFDAPRAFDQPLLLSGTEYHDPEAEPGTPPLVSYYANTQPLPVYFVRVNDLDEALSDDVLTLQELEGLESLRKGLATESRHYIRSLSNSTTVALGELDDGTPFFLRVFEVGETLETEITFSRHRVDPVSANGGVPAYLEIGSQFVPEDPTTGKLPLLFWRSPDNVPASSNLLELDAPRAWNFARLFDGHEFRPQGTPLDAPPLDYFYENDGAMPIYFVDRSDFDSVVTDGRLTISELNGLASLQKGQAEHVSAYTTLSGATLGGSSAYAAAGTLENGESFFVDVSELPGEAGGFTVTSTITFSSKETAGTGQC